MHPAKPREAKDAPLSTRVARQFWCECAREGLLAPSPTLCAVVNASLGCCRNVTDGTLTNSLPSDPTDIRCLKNAACKLFSRVIPPPPALPGQTYDNNSLANPPTPPLVPVPVPTPCAGPCAPLAPTCAEFEFKLCARVGDDRPWWLGSLLCPALFIRVYLWPPDRLRPGMLRRLGTRLAGGLLL